MFPSDAASSTLLLVPARLHELKLNDEPLIINDDDDDDTAGCYVMWNCERETKLLNILQNVLFCFFLFVRGDYRQGMSICDSPLVSVIGLL